MCDSDANPLPSIVPSSRFSSPGNSRWTRRIRRHGLRCAIHHGGGASEAGPKGQPHAPKHPTPPREQRAPKDAESRPGRGEFVQSQFTTCLLVSRRGLATLESLASWFLAGLAPFWREWTEPNKVPQSMTGTGTGQLDNWTFDKRQGQASKSSRHAATRHKRPNHGAGRSAPIDVSLQPSPHPWINTYKALVSLPTPPPQWRLYRSVVPISLDCFLATTILSSGVYFSQLDFKEQARYSLTILSSAFGILHLAPMESPMSTTSNPGAFVSRQQEAFAADSHSD